MSKKFERCLTPSSVLEFSSQRHAFEPSNILYTSQYLGASCRYSSSDLRTTIYMSTSLLMDSRSRRLSAPFKQNRQQRRAASRFMKRFRCSTTEMRLGHSTSRDEDETRTINQNPSERLFSSHLRVPSSWYRLCYHDPIVFAIVFMLNTYVALRWTMDAPIPRLAVEIRTRTL
jgi:hypothetical protein